MHQLLVADETILGVWAHPDDETYLSGGLMAMAVDAGARVVCATATRGEAGSQDEERWPIADIARVRERELDEALSILGVREHVWLDYRDGQCPQVPDEEAVSKIATLIEEVRPRMVLTFGPEGMTGHSDHVCVSRWTTEAFGRVGDADARLLYAAQTQEIVDRYAARLNEAFNVFAPGTPIATPEDELAIALRLEGEMLERKITALKAQRSQTEIFIGLVGEEFYRALASFEFFRPAG